MSFRVDINKVAKRFPALKPWDIEALSTQFSSFGLDANGYLNTRDLPKLCQQAAPGKSYDEVRAAIRQVNTGSQSSVEFDEFLEIVTKLKDAPASGGSGSGGGVRGAASAFGGVSSGTSSFGGSASTSSPSRGVGGVLPTKKNVITVQGATESTAHSINEDEKAEFTIHINQVLAGDSDVGDKLPIDENTMQLFDECRDGLLLSKLINTASPDTIDERVLNRGKKLSHFQMIENNNVVVNSAKAIGCSVVNIGSQDLMEGREHLILGLVWQIIKISLLAKIDIKYHPELYRLLEENETIERFLRLPPDVILLRWFNYHLKAAGWGRRVTNFSTDVKDGENYTVLLNQIAPNSCSRAPLQEHDLLRRAEMVLQNADSIGCRRYLSPKTLVAGNPKLNLAFVAHLFNTHPCLEPLDESTDRAELDDALFGNAQFDREARAFALWLNSLGVEPFVNSLFDDLRDGLVLLQVYDKLQPGLVQWRRVNKIPANAVPNPEDGSLISRFKQLENTNYSVDLGKQLGFKLVAMQGADISDGIPVLTLGLVWQLMRENIVQTLKSLAKNGREVTDVDMINWANTTAQRNTPGTLKSTGRIGSFKDSSLRTSLFLADVLNGMKPGLVDYSALHVGANMTDEQARNNAKYVISAARKIGATIFLLPEDIVEIKPKMILTLIGSLMNVEQQSKR
ncbi:hypothetical protein GQ42DRAFT_164910 [Ramicandelaber brevisporus]|nr:hypothetical protein GQ42DRAFT_164910 [Ramicandelaber brevisporus]